MKLIDKDVLTEKLWERRIKHRDFGGSPYSEFGHEDDEILSLINSLEVKEVDLEKEVELWMQGKPNVNFEWGNVADAMRDCAKQFFELGLKAREGE